MPFPIETCSDEEKEMNPIVGPFFALMGILIAIGVGYFFMTHAIYFQGRVVGAGIEVIALGLAKLAFFS